MPTLPLVNSAEELEALILDLGFLPLVDCGVPGFSVQRATPPGRWFVHGVEGPWEWREAIADRGVVVYAKLFAGKAGFVSPAYYPHFVNWRRGGLPFHERYASGQISRLENQIMAHIHAQGPALTRDLRAALGPKGLDTALTRLQMRTDLLVQRLEYNRDAQGNPYGWGISRLARPEDVLPEPLLHASLGDPPEASRARVAERLRALCPEATEKEMGGLLKW